MKNLEISKSRFSEDSRNIKKKHLSFRSFVISTVGLIVLISISVVIIFLFSSSVKKVNNTEDLSASSSHKSKIFLLKGNGSDNLLYSMNPDGSDMKIVIEMNLPFDLKFSRDGKWITFFDSRTKQIKVIKSDGSKINILPMKFVTDPEPALSLNGSKLVYALFDEDRCYNILSIDLLNQETGPKMLKKGRSTVTFSNVQFTPDGKFIVYKVTENRLDNLNLMDAESGKFIRTITPKGHFDITSYNISPDGNTIYYSTFTSYFDKNDKGSFYKLKIDGTQLKLLSEFWEGAWWSNITISPDEKYFLFTEGYAYSDNRLLLKRIEIESVEIEDIEDDAGNKIYGIPLLWT